MVIVLIMLCASPKAATAAQWPGWLPSLGPAPEAASSELAGALAALRARPDQTPALAVHVTPEGHWQFASRSDETFTAGTPDELKRVPAALAPGVTEGFAGLQLILSQDSLFAGQEALKDMPAATYFVAVDGEALALERIDTKTRALRLRPNLAIALSDKDSLVETLAQLRRPLDASRIRVLAATQGGPATLPAAAKFDSAQGGAAIDPVDPGRIAEALGSIPRQTAVLTARLDGAYLTVAPATGPEHTTSVAALAAAAGAADVDLVVLQADPPRQPGGRNWLWQRVQVSGLEHAARRATFADFVDALAAGRGTFAVSVSAASEGRVTLTARQVAASLTSTAGVTGWIRQATDAVTGQVTGAVTPAAIHANLVSDARRRELARRLIPGLPSQAQLIYFAAAAAGLLAWPVARRWFRRLWPVEARADFDNSGGYVIARAVRAIAFITLFLPLAAFPALAARLAGMMTPRKFKPSPQTSRANGP